ncbi:hypothetical protein ANN_14142 [Periplaneta americana]|uniref:Uncharacterized protein n=1 Tax=Periplaneta americana TaxID=6978 RepID=A0ABQ8SW30_PERAM|nr:hypothetical protein ANN_14142 [Periplaneta americana]
MAGLCEGGNEPPGSLNASKNPRREEAFLARRIFCNGLSQEFYQGEYVQNALLQQVSGLTVVQQEICRTSPCCRVVTSLVNQTDIQSFKSSKALYMGSEE